MAMQESLAISIH